MRKIDRRTFLRISGILGIGIATFSLPSLRRIESERFDKKNYKISCTRLGMGTFISMTIIDPSRHKAEEAIGKAFERIKELSDELNRFNSISAVYELNSSGSIKEVPPHMGELIRRSLGYYRMTEGCFDITVKPIIDLFQEKFSKGLYPEEREIEERLRLVGSDKIALSGKKIFFKEKGMGITLDGIAKGYIVDRAAEVLERYGIENYLINAGGDIRVKGEKSRGRPWRIAIQDPEKRGNYPDVICMKEGAIATSGNYEIYFDREKLFFHIIDPRTGRSPLTDISVSVVSKTACDADALSTAVFVMKPEEGIRFINSLPKREAFIITRERRRLKSSGWNRLKA